MRCSYYLTFSRTPTLGLDEWRAAFDDFAADGVESVVLWIGGGFRSRKYPVTWHYNADHRNVQEDFVGALIDYAHSLGIRVLLGFTPFTYDGVNQYAFERPDLKALRSDGTLARMQGIHCWGYGLNPAKADAQQFMLEYARELCFEFYPNADGMLIESSDIDISSNERYYALEYEFVRQISEEMWARNPAAEIIVYPHYFAPEAGPLPYDARWTLNFTPHSAFLDAGLIEMAGRTIYGDIGLMTRRPADIRESVRTVIANGVDSYLASHEFFTYVPTRAESFEPNIVGRPLHPFGIDTLSRYVNPYADPVVMVNRIALREFGADVDLPDDEFRKRLGTAIFGDERLVADLLYVHECIYRDRSFFTGGPMSDPSVVRNRLEQGRLGLADLDRIAESLDRIPAIVARLDGVSHPAALRLRDHAAGIAGAWDPDSKQLVRAHLRTT
jgi:hypothetical protein